VQCSRDLGRHRHAAAWQTEYDGVAEIGTRTQPCGEALAGVDAVRERHATMLPDGAVAYAGCMPTYVSLLRAVNVGGRTVPMATLREAYESLGFADVQTYIQSGNVVFTTNERSATAVGKRIEAALARETKLDVRVLLRTAAEMQAVVERNPFRISAENAKTLHVTFLASRPPAARVKAIDRAKFAPDEFVLEGREIFGRYPNGYGRSKMTNVLFERALGIDATTRNWNSVCKLAALAQG
jgi:uncharacterized protein (DUF1697 family)